MNKFALKNALSQLKLNIKFHSIKLDSSEKDQDEWISYLEGVRLFMKLEIKGKIVDNYFMIHVVNNLKECNVILDHLENHLELTSPDALMIEVIYDKLKHQ